MLLIALALHRGWGRISKWIVPAAVLALAIGYPYYGPNMPELPLFGPFPAVSTMVMTMIFTMMALGLNFVVGYAGLLDLGYVAFYAIGAYSGRLVRLVAVLGSERGLRRRRSLPGRHRRPLLDLARAADRRDRSRRSSAC